MAVDDIENGRHIHAADGDLVHQRKHVDRLDYRYEYEELDGEEYRQREEEEARLPSHLVVLRLECWVLLSIHVGKEATQAEAVNNDQASG